MSTSPAQPAISPAPELRELPVKELVSIPINGISLQGELVVPPHARGVVLFMLLTGHIDESSRVALIARAIEARGLATLSFPLLTESETQKDRDREYWSLDLDLLAHRLLQATHWAIRQPQTRELGIGYVATGTHAAAAIIAAAQLGYAVQAIVSRAGRPDLADESLPRVMAPTLLIVGERDHALFSANRRARERLVLQRLVVVAGAGHLFEEPGALEQVAELTAEWLGAHLKPIPRT